MPKNKIVLISLGNKYDNNSFLSILPDKVIQEIQINYILSSPQSKLWNPVSRNAIELYNKKHKKNCDVSNKQTNLLLVMSWPQEERNKISKDLMALRM